MFVNSPVQPRIATVKRAIGRLSQRQIVHFVRGFQPELPHDFQGAKVQLFFAMKVNRELKNLVDHTLPQGQSVI